MPVRDLGSRAAIRQSQDTSSPPAASQQLRSPTAGGAQTLLQTGVYNLDTPEGRKQVEQNWTQTTGLTVDHAGEAALEQQIGAKTLQQAAAGFTAEKMESMPAAQLQKQWGAFVAQAHSSCGGFDANTLVQYVIREAYMAKTQDLNFYAQKVKFFSGVKKAFREELQKAREFMAKAAGLPDDAELDPPYLFTEIDTTPPGGQKTEGQKELEAYTAAQAGLTQANEAAQTGGGVKLLSADEKAALDPAANGDVFETADGYRIDVKGPEVRIYEPGANGKHTLKTRIWGDPHVDEKATGGGDDWHFGDDSTFILPDGSKICLNTEETSPGSGIYVVKGVDVLSGGDHAMVGLSPEGNHRGAAVGDDRIAWDAAHADTAGSSGGVFALQGNGQWAMKGADGQFRDVSQESWSGYLSSKDVTTQGGAVSLGAAQAAAADDSLQTAAMDALAAKQEAATALAPYAALTRADLETYITNNEERMSSVGDDAQLANVDLQNQLQQQQQTLQKMSNISKVLHDTAMATVRKMG